MGGLYYDEFEVERVFEHPITRTVTETDNLLFTALTHNPSRFISMPNLQKTRSSVSGWSTASSHLAL